VPEDKGRIVLAYGEVTGHAHAIEDHRAERIAIVAANASRAQEIADAAVERLKARADIKARLWQAPDGERYLEVAQPVTLRHEEHTAHAIPPGLYKLPRQVEYTPGELRGVMD
jgi:uncharacterized protein (DUF885 family)